MFINTIDPVLLELGFISIRWYGVFLAFGVGLTILVALKLFKKNNISIDLVFSLTSYLIIAGLVGARLGYILFYNPLFYLNNPKEIIFINHGGLSSHGMTLGIIIMLFLLFKLKKINKKTIDLLIIPIPIVAAFIRLGNFFNSELVGRSTNLSWAVRFPNYEANPILRHPVQIYELITALAIFLILYFLYKNLVFDKNLDSSGIKKYSNKLPVLSITALFILLYFSSRFVLEFFKEYQIFNSGLTMGQYLSIPFIIWSILWLLKLRNQESRIKN